MHDEEENEYKRHASDLEEETSPAKRRRRALNSEDDVEEEAVAEAEEDEAEEEEEEEDEEQEEVAAANSPLRRRQINVAGKPPEAGVIQEIHVENFMVSCCTLERVRWVAHNVITNKLLIAIAVSSEVHNPTLSQRQFHHGSERKRQVRHSCRHSNLFGSWSSSNAPCPQSQRLGAQRCRNERSFTCQNSRFTLESRGRCLQARNLWRIDYRGAYDCLERRVQWLQAAR